MSAKSEPDRLARIERLLVQLNRRLRRLESRPLPPIHIHNSGGGEPGPVAGTRAKGCGSQILALLRAGPRYYSDIQADLTRHGHSASIVREHLKQLVTMGAVSHPHKGAPYSLPADDEP